MKRSVALMILTVFIVFGLFVPVVLAAKKTSKARIVSILTSVNRKKRSVTIYLKNLQLASSVTYQLSYLTNGKPEGAGGTITPKKKYSLSRTLLFATCSAGVCRYHKNITNALVTVTIKYKSGKTATKTFKLKI